MCIADPVGLDQVKQDRIWMLEFHVQAVFGHMPDMGWNRELLLLTVMLHSQVNIDGIAISEGAWSTVRFAMQQHAMTADVQDAASFGDGLFANQKGIQVNGCSGLTMLFHVGISTPSEDMVFCTAEAHFLQ